MAMSWSKFSYSSTSHSCIFLFTIIAHSLPLTPPKHLLNKEILILGNGKNHRKPENKIFIPTPFVEPESHFVTSSHLPLGTLKHTILVVFYNALPKTHPMGSVRQNEIAIKASEPLWHTGHVACRVPSLCWVKHLFARKRHEEL